mmetsp:Transcript_25709/g.74362  ORF Transcript_25709/g.74362 Transcript_25709/m.74362 type:complete len:126 (+) Transcript_25709:78-455(+)
MSAPQQMNIGNGGIVQSGADTDLPGMDVKDVAGCWRQCGCLCCHWTIAQGNDYLCDLFCIPCIPFPIPRCIDRDPRDPRAWHTRKDMKGNWETWTMTDRNTVHVQGHNDCCGDMNSLTMTRCCAR